MSRYFNLQNLPEILIFTNYFLTNKDVHNYNTRNALMLHKNCNRTNYKKRTLAIKGIDLWNNLPVHQKQLGHIPYSRQQLKSISFIRDTIIYEAIVKFRSLI